MNLILFGFKGCGKSHFGKLFAEQSGRTFIDTDDLVDKKIYREWGEKEFRKREKEAIFSLNVKNAVIALGGGAVLDRDNVKFLQKIGKMVYLKANPETIRKRMLELPAFLENWEAFGKMIQEREPIYEAIDAKWIDTEREDVLAVLHGL